MKPLLLDLFCGAGGCSVGYARAGFAVVGIDEVPHADYPYPMHVADALDVLTAPRWRAFTDAFDVIHASPPCPRFSTATPAHRRDDHPDLLAPTLDALRAWAARTGGTWIVENVPGAPVPDPVLLCGPALGLTGIRRHRLFASNAALLTPGCACGPGQPFGVYGNHGGASGRDGDKRPDGTSRGRKADDVAHAQRLLGIDWMTLWDDLCDAIPPAYTEHVGSLVLDQLRAAS